MNKYKRIISGLAVIGLLIMSYLTYIHYANAESFCDISETVSCDVVTTSIYSEIFGFPVAILGLGYFAFVLWQIFSNKKDLSLQTIFFITIFVLVPSLYLSSLELLVIKAVCVLCETSKLIMVIILITSFIAIHKNKKITARMIIPFIIFGLVASGVTYFAQTSRKATQDYTEFVKCSNSKGIIYYKSFRCSNCKRQELLIGEPYKKLNSVECHPKGPNGNPELCFKMGVTKTPTFILEKDGEEIKRTEGLQQMEDLSKFSGCSLN